ncbi:MAG TPA: energy transducer TonB [Opitutaceae bacterium]|nr:energy transducer TonB [Opitutaceae bacterium]
MSLISPDKELDQYPVPKFPIQAVTPYPWELKRAGIEGTVEARLSIDEQGRVTKVEILSSPPTGKYFEDAVGESVQKCQFFPAIRKGHAVACTAVYKFEFTLDGL